MNTSVDDGRARAKAARWRREFGIDDGGRTESVGDSAPAPDDRLAMAREAMTRLVADRFGGDAALAEQVKSITLTASEALAVLQEAETIAVPTNTQIEALEAVVIFDGTRPSFLLKSDEIDFNSSFNTGTWKQDLAPFRAQLTAHAACVGRVELDGRHIATAFLVTPTLAITNRHVAQGIATFANGTITMFGDCRLDFGREDGTGRSSFDQRTITSIAFAGEAKVGGVPIDHELLDLAVLRVSASALSGAAAQRHLAIGGVNASDLVDDSRFVAAVGYPADPELVVPGKILTEFGDVIRKLLEGDGGAKRFAPGQPMTAPRDGLTDWTAIHDASTLNGNSGSPLLAFPVAASPRAAALHYGGRFGGDRVNWAHLLHYAGSKVGYVNQGTFADFCAREGIEFAHD